jgi:hypothetical protein
LCLKPPRRPNTPAQKIQRDLDEDARDVARAFANAGYEHSRHRREKVLMLFAQLKRILRPGRLRLRGPCDARDEFLLAATAQNLGKLAKLRPMTALAWAEKPFGREDAAAEQGSPSTQAALRKAERNLVAD